MAKKNKSMNIENNKFYTVVEAANLMGGITNQSILKYLKDGSLKGEQRGPKKKWFIIGASITTKMKDWKFLK